MLFIHHHYYLFLNNECYTIVEKKIEKVNKNGRKNIIYNIEQHSSHPIAKSLCSAFKENSSPLELNNIIEEKGVSI